MKGAKGVLIHITGGPDLTLFEADEAANRIRSEVDCDANIKVGSTFDAKLEGRIRVSVVATGIDAGERVQKSPVTQPQANAIGRNYTPARAQPAAAATPIAAVQPQLSLPENLIAAQPEIFVRARRRRTPSTPCRARPRKSCRPISPASRRRWTRRGPRSRKAEAAISRQRQVPTATPASRTTVSFDDFAISAESGGIRGGSDPMARPGLTPEPSTGIMGTLGGLFTRSKAKRAGNGSQTRYQPEPEATVNPPRPIEPRFAEAAGPRATARTVKAPETPSLFTTSPAEDPLEIPAFLRRQANS